MLAFSLRLSTLEWTPETEIIKGILTILILEGEREKGREEEEVYLIFDTVTVAHGRRYTLFSAPTPSVGQQNNAL
ncbi:MAG: hypothetical protein MJE68_25430 [Proteobacteria bacterium]|nr:hypothetical protein [Pseudomonadota bacterium]